MTDLKLSSEATAQFVLALQSALLNGTDVSEYLRSVRYNAVDGELYPQLIDDANESSDVDLDDDSFDDLT